MFLSTKEDIITKVHLIISVIIVVPVAIMYAFFPDAQFELFPKTTDEHNFYKAIMGLYLACSVIWILGVFNARLLKTALITNLVFMLGLGFGRLLSVVLDGPPSLGYLYGMIAEIALGIYGFWVLKRIPHKLERKKH
ncbi:DUF4345 domain-containing protein [Psychroserpens sp. XS_ASV72]|uniref:DUF4345 domain-containing protein n=1 Tax=Psychroserpens sp. XS_ASV72 TaxID=3241293 RepID=UPI003516A11F